jgi:sulfur-oxidizing protein SoxZ
METGLRKSDVGDVIPAHYIQLVTATYGDRTVLSAQWGPAVSSESFCGFQVQGRREGGIVKVTWTDNHVESRARTRRSSASP